MKFNLDRFVKIFYKNLFKCKVYVYLIKIIKYLSVLDIMLVIICVLSISICV